MSLNFLQRIAQALPHQTSDQDEIDHVAILCAAKLVIGQVPESVDGRYVGAARIDSLTPEGRAVLALLRARKRP